MLGVDVKPADDTKCGGGRDKEKWRRAKEQEKIAFFPVSH